MRYLERQILLQIIDLRWREHLYEMDYLREGIHLRGFAQIDPLVAYKNEGFTMFHELMNSIWEEFARVIYHVEVERRARRLRAGARRRSPPSCSTRAAGRSSLPRSSEAAGRGGGRRRRRRRSGAGDGRGRLRQRPGVGREPGDGGQVRSRQDRPQRSLLVRLRQEVQEVPWRLAVARRHPRPSSKPSTTRICDALVAVLDPEVEIQASRGIVIGHDEARLLGDPQGRGRPAPTPRPRRESATWAGT